MVREALLCRKRKGPNSELRTLRAPVPPSSPGNGASAASGKTVDGALLYSWSTERSSPERGPHRKEVRSFTSCTRDHGPSPSPRRDVISGAPSCRTRHLPDPPREETIHGQKDPAQDPRSKAANESAATPSPTPTRNRRSTFELACDTAGIARERGIENVFVTNGYMTEEALTLLAPPPRRGEYGPQVVQ